MCEVALFRTIGIEGGSGILFHQFYQQEYEGNTSAGFMAENVESKIRDIVYVDMDGVVVNFPYDVEDVDESIRRQCVVANKAGRHHSDVEGLFATLLPIEGAAEAIDRLMERYEVYLLSTSPWANTNAWSDKRRWVAEYLPNLPTKRLILSHRKDLNRGAFLIDDRPNNGAAQFGDYAGQEWIHFGSANFPDWPSVLTYLGNLAQK